MYIKIGFLGCTLYHFVDVLAIFQWFSQGYLEESNMFTKTLDESGFSISNVHIRVLKKTLRKTDH